MIYSNPSCIGAVMVIMVILSVVDGQFEPRSVQSKDYTIGIYCLSAKHTVLWSNSQDLLAWNQEDISQWSNMSTSGLLFQGASTIKIQLSMLVQCKADIIIIIISYNSMLVKLYFICRVQIKSQLYAVQIQTPNSLRVYRGLSHCQKPKSYGK